MSNQTGPGAGMQPQRPSTPPNQRLESATDGDFDPTMSPGAFVGPEGLENPFGFGGALPGSVAVASDPPSSAPPPPSSSALTTSSFTTTAAKRPSEDGSSSNGKKAKKAKKVGDDLPSFLPPNNHQNPPDDDDPFGGNGSSANLFSSQGTTTHQNAGASQTDVEMSGTTYSGPSGEQHSLNPNIAMPSIEAHQIEDSAKVGQPLQENGAPHKPTTPTNLVRPVLSYQPQLVARDHSAPPGLYSSGYASAPPKNDFVDRTNPTVVAPYGTPVHAENLTFLQRQLYWCSLIKDPAQRQKTLDKTCEALKKTWADGIKYHLIPNRLTVGTESLTGEELTASLEAQLAQEKQAKQKKLQDPTKIIMVEVKRFIFTEVPKTKGRIIAKPIPVDRSITAGELSEAGVKWSNVEARIQKQNLDDDGSFVERCVAGFPGQAIIPSKHWQGTQPKTINNPIGRNLKLYCLWEVFRCDAQIGHLENMLEMVGAADESQKAVVDGQIEAETVLKDKLMAIAMELDPKTKTYVVLDDSDDDDEEPESQVVGKAKERSVLSLSADSSPEVCMPAIQSLTLLTSPQSTPAYEASIPLTRSSVPTSVPRNEMRILGKDFDKDPRLHLKLREYYKVEIYPRANELLKAAGHEELEDHTLHWNIVRKALIAAKVSQEARDNLLVDLNVYIHALNNEKGDKNVVDVPGYPTRQEIWTSIPPHGVSNPELKLMFPNMKAGDLTWQKLVQSVADYRDNQWFPKPTGPEQTSATSLPPGFGHTLPIRLKIGRPFDPQEFSARTVNNTKGFKWRFVETSSIAQREAMDPVIEDFVNNTIHSDKFAPVPLRHGRYDVLVNPGKPEEGGIVHGLWDISKNRPVPDDKWQWFYNGEMKDITTYHGYKSMEPVFNGTPEEVAAFLDDKKRRAYLMSLAAQTQTQTGPTQALASSKGTGKEVAVPVAAVNKPAFKLNPPPKGKFKGKVNEKPSIKFYKDRNVDLQKSPTAGKRGAGKASNGVRGGAGGKKRKIKVEEDDSPRPKRSARRALNYAEEDGLEGEDDDWQIGDGISDDD